MRLKDMVNYRFHQQCSLCDDTFRNKKDMQTHKYEVHSY